MAFSNFKAISDVQERFRITYVTDNFLGTEEILKPSEQFLSELEFNMKYINVYASDGARCENVIYPILREVYKGYADGYALWVKKTSPTMRL